MSNPTNVGDNPNDEMPAGNPPRPDQVVPERVGGDADEHPPQNEHDELIDDEFEGLDNDLVNVGKFSDPAAEDDGLAPPDEDEDRPGLPGEPAIEKSNTLQKP